MLAALRRLRARLTQLRVPRSRLFVQGAGLYLSAITYATLQGCVVSGNVASNTGGGWWVSQHSMLSMTASTTSGNRAAVSGGGGWCSDAVVTLSRDTVSGNSAAAQGGGVLVSGGCQLNANASDVVGNSAATGGASCCTSARRQTQLTPRGARQGASPSLPAALPHSSPPSCAATPPLAAPVHTCVARLRATAQCALIALADVHVWPSARLHHRSWASSMRRRRRALVPLRCPSQTRFWTATSLLRMAAPWRCSPARSS